jgi:RNA polymerase sigma-70 factor, ECF subfamily
MHMENTAARKRFDEQFVRSHRHVFRYIAALVPNRDDAEEVFQETCLKILEKWRDFDAERPMVPWACGIAQNMARKFYERNRRRGLPLSEIAIAAVSETQHRLSAEVDLRLQKLPDCLQRLTDQQRCLLEQCYGQQGSIRAVAEASHLDPNTVYKRLERIRRNLFECIELAITKE